MQFNVPIGVTHVDPGKAAIKTDSQPPSETSSDPLPAQSLLDILLETHTQILNLYQRSTGYLSAEPVPVICYTDNIIRVAKLLCDVYITGGLDDAALRASAFGGIVEQRRSMSSKYPPRGEIARWAMKAWGASPEHDTIPVSHRIRIIAALMQIMATIGFHRRRAALLSELLHILIPQLVQARVVGASEWGLHPNIAQGVLHDGTGLDDGLVDLMESLAKIYGANVRSDDKPVYGWPSLRAYVLRECIEFCEALSHRAGVAHFTSLLFTVAGDQIDKDEQVRLAGNLPRIAGSSRKKGVLIETDYWDMFLVQNIEIVGYHTPNTLLNCCVGPLKASCAHQHRLAFDKSLL